MKKLFRLLKVNKFRSFIMILNFILVTFSTFYLLYAISLLSGIENNLRLVVAAILGLIYFCFDMAYYHSLAKKKSKTKTTFVITLLYSLLLIFIGFYIIKTYTTVKNMTSDTTTYSSSLVTLATNKVNSIDKATSGKIGILGDSTSIDGNNIPKETIKLKKLNNEIMEYDSFIDLLNALLDKEIKYAFLPTNYIVMFQNIDGAGFDKINENTKAIYTKEKVVKKKSISKNSTLDKPFTILLTGVDSETEEIANASSNGDTLMLLTFNPKTLSTTMLSIPRDTYVPIMCFTGHRKNKITHAAWYGEECIIDTIENYTGINIDYFLKINFKGVVKLVDKLGGIEVDVPYAFCEQNSNREWGTKTVFVEKGLQTLNGEQALALSRNRHYPGDAPLGETREMYRTCPKLNKGIRNDFIRGQNQQTVLKAILNKMKSVRNINTVTELLNTISKSMETNMNTSEILSLYNVGKDILAKNGTGDVADLISMQRLYLNGSDATIYDSVMRLYLYNYVVYDKSLAAVTEAMRINLGLEEPKIVKTFQFSIDEPYEENIIGKNITGNTSVKKLPDFTGDSETQAKLTCSKLGITPNFKYVTTGSGVNNTVISQSYAYGYDISYIKTITFTILKKEEIKEPVKSNTTTVTNTTKPVTNTTTVVNSTSSSEESDSSSEDNSNEKNEETETDTPSTEIE